MPVRVRDTSSNVVDIETLRQNPTALLRPMEVAVLFRVDPKTVARWAKSGKLRSVKTVGGHRRYQASDIVAVMDAVPQD